MSDNDNPAVPVGVETWAKAQCSRLTYGQCSTLRCLNRGGHVYGEPANYDAATCEAFEVSNMVRRLPEVMARVEKLEAALRDARDALDTAADSLETISKMSPHLAVVRIASNRAASIRALLSETGS